MVVVGVGAVLLPPSVAVLETLPLLPVTVILLRSALPVGLMATRLRPVAVVVVSVVLDWLPIVAVIVRAELGGKCLKLARTPLVPSRDSVNDGAELAAIASGLPDARSRAETTKATLRFCLGVERFRR